MSKRAPPQFRKNTPTKENSLQENALCIPQICFWEIVCFDRVAILQVCLRSLCELINCMRGKSRNRDLEKPSNQPRIHPTFYVGHTHELGHTRVRAMPCTWILTESSHTYTWAIRGVWAHVACGCLTSDSLKYSSWLMYIVRDWHTTWAMGHVWVPDFWFSSLSFSLPLSFTILLPRSRFESRVFIENWQWVSRGQGG